jgi:tRNA U54 and U55 pseudouridine synthase Pus10
VHLSCFSLRDELNHLKMGEESKSKSYEAYCVCLEGTLVKEKLDDLATIKNLELQQQTPIRVLHRRPLATRSRTIIEMSAELVSNSLLSYFWMKIVFHRLTRNTLNCIWKHKRELM